MNPVTVATVLTASLLLPSAGPETAPLKSGLQQGDYPFAYYVCDVTGPAAGQRLCYRCNYGTRPVVNIFARKVDNNVMKLVETLDNVVGTNQDQQMAAYVVLLSDDPEAQKTQLRTSAARHSIRHTPLTVFENSAGPRKYRLSAEADVTVIMWVDDDVKVSHAFRLADLTTDNIARVADDTQKILN